MLLCFAGLELATTLRDRSSYMLEVVTACLALPRQLLNVQESPWKEEEHKQGNKKCQKSDLIKAFLDF